MKTQELSEHDVRGEQVSGDDYPVLYHLTDYQGLTHTAIQNAIRSRSNYLSTTYSPEMVDVGGRMHYHFRFTIDGRRAINDFNGYKYDSYAQVVGGGTHKWEESEIGLDTKTLPLDYLTELSFIPAIQSRYVAQWLFYKTEAGINGAKALEYLIQQGLKLTKLDGYRIDVKDRYFLERCIELQDHSYAEAMDKLVGVFDVTDFDFTQLTKRRWELEKKQNEIKADCNKLAGAFGSFNVKQVMRDITKWVKVLAPDDATKLIGVLSSSGIVNHYLSPARMYGLLWSLVKYGPDEFVAMVEMISDEQEKQQKFSETKYIHHYPTG